MSPKVAIDRVRLAEFCRRNGIRRLAVFGSAFGDDFGPRSDIDVLVESVHSGFSASGTPCLRAILLPFLSVRSAEADDPHPSLSLRHDGNVHLAGDVTDHRQPRRALPERERPAPWPNRNPRRSPNSTTTKQIVSTIYWRIKRTISRIRDQE